MSDIAWTKEWSAADDGTIVSGSDLGNMQSDIEGGITTNATAIQGVPVDAPTAADDQNMLYYDNVLLTFGYKSLDVLPDGASLTTSAAPTTDAGIANKKYVDDSIEALQTVVTTLVTSSTTGTAIPLDDTIPTSSEGAEIMTRAITPNSATDRLEIEVLVFVSAANVQACTIALFQDSGAAAINVGTATPPDANTMVPVMLKHIMVAGTTSETTFKIRVGASTGGANPVRWNGTVAGGSRSFGGVLTSSITIRELKP